MTKPRKIVLMHKIFGAKEDHTCGECSNFVSEKYKSRVLQKCKAYGLTHSEATDWVKRWTACGLFNEQYIGVPVIEVIKGKTVAFSIHFEEPMDGQISFDELEVQE